ncbi:MAG: serine/threonine protein kinase, partial [Bdellovibrionales bacterium]|nr:serine/threonine protein kinase [Bdellovibrionales bacterium]
VVAMHDQGVLHRDLKPANVMVSRSGSIVITDLGLAKNAPTVSGSFGLDNSASRHIYSELSRDGQGQTSQGDVVGTPLYLAPEYLMEGTADISCDVYALGVIAYELITGEAPFDGEPLYKFLIRKVKEDPIEPHKLRRKCPGALSQIIMEAIHRNPKKRFPDARAFLRAIESLKIVSLPIVTISKEDKALLEASMTIEEDTGPGVVENLKQGAALTVKIVWGVALLVVLTCGVILMTVFLMKPQALNALLQGDFQTVINTIKLVFR